VIRLIRSELLKLRTTSSPWVLLIVTLLLTALGVITAFLIPNGNRVTFGAPTTIYRYRLLLGAGDTAVWMSAILGMLCVTGEYRHKVITTTLLVEPKRAYVLVAKSVASVLWGLILCASTFVMVAALGLPLLSAEGGSASILLHQAGAVVPGLFAAFAIIALFGVGFGTLVRNQVVGIVAVLGGSFILEPILDGLIPSVAKWLPSAAAGAVAGGLGTRADRAFLLSWWLGALVLAAWGIVPTVIGYFTTFTRDVT